MQEPDVPAALKQVTQCGAEFKMMETSFFLARQTLLPSSRPGMALWRERIFARSEEHTSELQSLMRISYAVFCLKKKKTNTTLLHKCTGQHEKSIIYIGQD